MSANQALGRPTPEQYVATHSITTRLRELGVTADQLAAMRFRGNRRQAPFDNWSFSWANGMPMEAMPYVKAYCALKWLILDIPPPSRDKEDAYRYVNDAVAAPFTSLGLKHQDAQRRRARRSRVKVTDNGRTIRQVVEGLVCRPEHREESAAQLWLRFYGQLDELGLDPEEINHPSDPRRHRYEYMFGDNRRKISYGQFANLVAMSRAGEIRLAGLS